MMNLPSVVHRTPWAPHATSTLKAFAWSSTRLYCMQARRWVCCSPLERDRPSAGWRSEQVRSFELLLWKWFPSLSLGGGTDQLLPTHAKASRLVSQRASQPAKQPNSQSTKPSQAKSSQQSNNATQPSQSEPTTPKIRAARVAIGVAVEVGGSVGVCCDSYAKEVK